MGFEISEKPNFIITIRYEILTFLSVGPSFKEGGRGSRKFWPEAEILGIFSIEVAPKLMKSFHLYCRYDIQMFLVMPSEFSLVLVLLLSLKQSPFITLAPNSGSFLVW